MDRPNTLSDSKFNPGNYGFDHSFGSLAGGVNPYRHSYKRGPYTNTWHRNGELLRERGHATDLITDELIRGQREGLAEPELYNIAADPLEEKDVAARNPEIVQRLLAILNNTS